MVFCIVSLEAHVGLGSKNLHLASIRMTYYIFVNTWENSQSLSTAVCNQYGINFNELLGDLTDPLRVVPPGDGFQVRRICSIGLADDCESVIWLAS